MRVPSGERGDAPDGSGARRPGPDPDATQALVRPSPPSRDETTVIGAGPSASTGTGPRPTSDSTVGPPGAADVTRPFVRDEVRPRPEPAPGWNEPPLDPPEPPEPPEPPRRRPPPRRPRRRFRFRWVVATLLLVAVLVPVLTWASVWFTARQDDRTPSDAIVVMGASQYNGRPSPVFEARLTHAMNLYDEGVAPAIVTVGGGLPGDNYTEGEAGRNWLVEQGVPSENVVGVGEGSDSLDSLEAVAESFDERGWSSAIIVSDPWHALRSKVIASDTGIDAGTSPARSGPAVLTRETQLWYITREAASLLYYWTFGESAGVKIEAV
nr:YdcF family protein [Spiractinospora alimapuensis]